MKILVILLFISLILCQDEIIFIDGSRLKGELDIDSITDTTSAIRFKPNNWKIYSFYNIDQINFVKSWNGRLLYPTGVIANIKSGYYHLPNVKHSPLEDNQIAFSNQNNAIDSGFLACQACFDTHPKISDYSLEQQIVKNIILQIQDSYEIMYEHPMLENLQKMMYKILNNWPEVLKGYNYRIQIIRDDAPNALAVAGGNLYFTTGLLNIIEDDLELEAVVAHEIAHVERRHTLREFKEYQRKQTNVAALVAFIAFSSVIMDSDNGIALANIVSIIGEFAVEFTQIGYNRDLEQEADLFSQIYFNNLGLDILPAISILDKLATFNLTRLGLIPRANAYSSHPDILLRVKQIENGVFFKYNAQIVMKLYPADPNLNIAPGFIDLVISDLYCTTSSENETDDQIVLLGTINNNDQELSYQINNIMLNFLGTLGETSLGGVIDLTVSYQSSTQFAGRIIAPKSLSKQVLESLVNKNFLPYGVQISAIVLQPGKDSKKYPTLQNIPCGMLIE